MRCCNETHAATGTTQHKTLKKTTDKSTKTDVNSIHNIIYYNNIYLIILQLVEKGHFLTHLVCRLLMFEPLSLGSKKPGLLLLAHSLGLSLHLLDDNVTLFQTKKRLIFSLHDVWWVRISITTQCNSIYVIIEQIRR